MKVPLHGLELAPEVHDVELRPHAGVELVSVDRLGEVLADALVHALEAGIQIVDLGPGHRKLAYDVYWDALAKRAPEPIKELRAASDALR